jgi:hypothetical protein
MSKKPFVKRPMFGVKHLRGRHPAEYVHEEKEGRRRRNRGPSPQVRFG